MMTPPASFLNFVCRELMGPAVAGSCWRCPSCDSAKASFSVRPPKGDFPIKFKCHKCQWWGDELDLLRFFFPESQRVDLYRKLLDLRERFNRLKHEYDRSRTTSPEARRGGGGKSVSGHTRASVSHPHPPGHGQRGPSTKHKGGKLNRSIAKAAHKSPSRGSDDTNIK